MIRLKINLDAVNGKHLFTGKKGRYLDVTLMDSPSKYGEGEFLAVQDVGKDAREAGERGPILGTWKRFEPRGNSPTPSGAQSASTAAVSTRNAKPETRNPAAAGDDDVPF